MTPSKTLPRKGTDLKERWAKLTECFLHFGPHPLENINLLTALGGSLLGGACALYNRLHEGKLISWGQWNTPEGYNPVDEPDGHICYDVIRLNPDGLYLVRDLLNSPYAESDPNVKHYQLRTYLGAPARLGNQCVGSLCIVFQSDFIPTPEDENLLQILSRAIGVEEKRMEAEHELKQSHQRLLTVFDSIEAVVYVADMKSHELLFMNHYAQYIFGNGVGKKCWEIFQKEQHGPCPDCVPLGLSLNGASCSRETQNSRNGRWYTMLDRAVEWLDHRPVRLQIAIDITERKEAETALRQSESTVRAILRAAPVGLALVKDRKMLWLNDNLLALTGYAQEDLQGKSTRLFYENDEEHEQASRLTGELETHFRRRNGQSIDVHLQTALFDPQDPSAGVIWAATDISEIKKYALEREHLITELQAAMQQIKTLKGIVPICSYCKKIRDDSGYWQLLEKFISDHTEASFSHGICPACYAKHFPFLVDGSPTDEQ
ncbi:MAG: PAS domain S-box protein [Thermodesulfobacteriota bacterium]